MRLGGLRGPVLVVGASDQGEVVVDLIRALPEPPEIRAVIDSGRDGRFIGRRVGGITVLDGVGALSKYAGSVAGAIPAVGAGAAREEIAAALETAGIPMLAVVHPRAHVAAQVEIGPGAVILAGAIVAVGARIGRAAIINSGAIVEHHSTIGDYAHVAPGARLAGRVRVGERAWVGIGATVLQGICIGPDAEIGAGAVVIRHVDAGATVAGVPARALRPTETARPERDLV